MLLIGERSIPWSDQRVKISPQNEICCMAVSIMVVVVTVGNWKWRRWSVEDLEELDNGNINISFRSPSNKE